jgi:hypothetical protein
LQRQGVWKNGLFSMLEKNNGGSMLCSQLGSGHIDFLTTWL